MITTTNETLLELWSKDDHAMYLFDRDKLIENIVDIETAFKAHYGNFSIAYSFKTNYLRAICDTMQKAGAYAEVVSPYERAYAMTIGFHPSRIIYNGVIPSASEKAKIAFCGGMVNVDSYEEFKDIEEAAKAYGEKIKLGVRANFDCGNGLNSRFGVDVYSHDFENLMLEIRSSDTVEFGGFHCHIGSARQLEFWDVKTANMVELVKSYGGSYIDLGGGMYGPMPEELSNQFPGYVDSFKAYADVIGPVMKRAFPDESVQLILENGTAMVGNTMLCAATVKGIKTVRGKQYVTVNCCSNQLGFICDCKALPTFIVRMGKGEERHVEKATIAGNTCLEYDYIRKDFTGDLAVGDRIVFKNVGAYSISASRQFIVPRLPVIDFDTGNTLKDEEGFLQMFSGYIPASK